MNHYQIRPLEKTDLKQMHRSFLEAFSDYPVTMQMSYQLFEQRMLAKLNISFPLSFGAFSGQKLVGFIFHCMNDYKGRLTIYNGGMGVIPGHRGYSLSTKLYQTFLAMTRTRAERCVLEVLTINDVAINIYEKIGFRKAGLYYCYKLSNVPETFQLKVEGLMIQPGSIERWPIYQEFDSIETSFSDTFQRLAHNASLETFVECIIEGKPIGYIIFHSASGRITRMAVAPEYRRKGIGSSLLHEAYIQSRFKNLTLINIPSNASDISEFLLRAGFENQINQWEMELML